MPLRAYIEDKEIVSIDLNDEEWSALKARLKAKEIVLTLPCCGQEGFLRTSNRGLKHFVHLKSANPCDWKPESAEHLKAKVAIMEACREQGWDAIPEFSEADWRADVLAVQGGKRIAFEVQWSRQTYEETRLRQERYKASNVRGCWFFRIAPKEMSDYDKTLVADKETPAFKIFKDENSNILAQVGKVQMPLKALISNLLARKLKFCEHIRMAPKQKITIIFFEMKCWKCGTLQYCYTVEPSLKSVCNCDFDVERSSWDDHDIDKHPGVYAAVQDFLQTEEGRQLKVGPVKKRYSRTVADSYLSHGCYYCDAIFGDFHLIEEKLYAFTGVYTIIDNALMPKSNLYGGFSVCSITSSFFIGVILRFFPLRAELFPPDGLLLPQGRQCSVKFVTPL